MRVIAGSFRGRRLAVPKGKRLVRPTADRVKESVFSILGDRVIGTRFLDLCAGTGSIGIEALSRGAKHVTFLEREARCIRSIEQNLQRCGVLPGGQDQYRLFRGDVVKGLRYLCKHPVVFEIIYFDPPYCEGARLFPICLPLLAEAALLGIGSALLIEHEKGSLLPEAVGNLRRSRQARYGGTVVSFYEYQDV